MLFLLEAALQDSSLDNPLNPNDLIIHALCNPSAKICRLFASFGIACDRNI